MATIETQLITAEEFFQWSQLPANRHRHFELDQGEIVEMPLPGKYHGFVCGNVARILGNYAIHRGGGYVCTNDAGIIVARDPDTVRGPDVTFYEDSETAENMQRKYAVQPPVLAVEVLSPTDRIGSMMARVSQLLTHGVRIVWVVDPEAHEVSVCSLGSETVVVSGQEKLQGGQVLNGFECTVAELFAVPIKPNMA